LTERDGEDCHNAGGMKQSVGIDHDAGSSREELFALFARH